MTKLWNPNNLKQRLNALTLTLVHVSCIPDSASQGPLTSQIIILAHELPEFSENK